MTTPSPPPFQASRSSRIKTLLLQQLWYPILSRSSQLPTQDPPSEHYGQSGIIISSIDERKSNSTDRNQLGSAQIVRKFLNLWDDRFHDVGVQERWRARCAALMYRSSGRGILYDQQHGCRWLSMTFGASNSIRSRNRSGWVRRVPKLDHVGGSIQLSLGFARFAWS